MAPPSPTSDAAPVVDATPVTDAGVDVDADAFVPIREVISVATDGTQANGNSIFASLTADARFVVFGSEANNLVPGDRNNYRDIFIRDRQSKTTERMSVSEGGIEGDGLSNDPSISDDGLFVGFASKSSKFAILDNNGTWDAFFLDRTTKKLTCLSCDSTGTTASVGSNQVRVSADGQWIAFSSDASLVPEDTNSFSDVYLYERATGTRRLISRRGSEIGNGTSWYPVISADGRFVAFDSLASNLVDNDRNNARDIFRFDRIANEITRMSVGTDGTEGTDLSAWPALSRDGQTVAFCSWSKSWITPTVYNLDVYARDNTTSTLERASRSRTGAQGSAPSWYPAVSGDGRYVAFDSDAENLIANDTNGLLDVFFFDRMTGLTTRIATTGTADSVSFVRLSPDGSLALFATSDDSAVLGDSNGKRDIVLMSTR